MVAIKTVRLMEWNSLNISANSAAPFHSGSAGVIRISVSLAIRNNVVVTTFQENLVINYQNAKVKIVL